MNLILWGTSHRTSTLQFRERLHVGEEGLRPALRILRRNPGILECVLLSTCNRFEVYLVAEDRDQAAEAVRRQLRGIRGVSDAEIRGAFYEKEGRECVAHLFCVAASLDSLVVGEPQILGQVKRAYQVALAERMTGTVSNTLFNRAVHVAKRVRTETGIARNPVSIPQVAVRFAERLLGDLSGRNALLLGAGKIGALTAEFLKSRGLRRVQVASRSPESSTELARRIGAESVAWREVFARLSETDILVCATDAPEPVLTAADVRLSRGKSAAAPLLAVDISVPRNLDPEIAKVPGVSLHSIEDLSTEVDRNRAERAAEAQAAEALIRAELERFAPALSSRGVELALASPA